MRKVSFDISISLDGFITGANSRPEACQVILRRQVFPC